MLDVIPKVALDSSEGQQLLTESLIKQTVLIRLFNKQQKQGFCGLASAAHVMSFQVLAHKYPDPSIHDQCDITDVRYTEDNIFEHEETRSVIGSAQDVQQKNEGTSLKEIGDLLKMHGFVVVMKSGDESHVDEFRQLAIEALSSTASGVILNFHHYSKVNWGHFSPLGAYHQKTDRFLIMDTRHDHPYVWVKVSDLYPLINTLDPFTNQSRGYLISKSNL